MLGRLFASELDAQSTAVWTAPVFIFALVLDATIVI